MPAISWNIQNLQTLSIAVAESNIANREHLLRCENLEMGYIVPQLLQK